MSDKAGKESQYIVSCPKTDSDPPIGSDRGSGCDINFNLIMLLFLFMMMEMGSARISFIFNFKDGRTNPRIEVMFGLRFLQ